MRAMNAVSDDYVTFYSRLTHAAKPYFARMAKKPIGRLEERFPNTVALLFDAALKYAKNQQDNLLAENVTIPFLVNLLQAEVKFYPEKIPEIFDVEGIRNNIFDVDLEGLRQLFHDYVVNVQIPSYTTVELLLEKGKIKMAHEEALKLTHTFDKTRSFKALIQYYLNHKNIQEALALFHLIPLSAERRDTVSRIISSLLTDKKFNEAISFSKELNDVDLRDHAIHEMSLWLVKEGRLETGITVLDKIVHDEDMKAYTLSLIVMILTSQGNFAKASELAFSIEDKDYKQDALNDIIKKMVRLRRLPEAEDFVNRLEGVIEKKEASKIIESGLKVIEQDRRIQKIQLF